MLTYGYGLTGAVEGLLNRFEAQVREQQFTEQVQLACSLDLSRCGEFEAEASELLHGEASFKRLDDSV